MRTGRAIAAALGLIAPLLLSCLPAPVRYVPASPRFGLSEQIRVQITSAELRVDPSGQVSRVTARVQLLGATPLALRSVWLNDGSASPCSGSTLATSVEQDSRDSFDERPYAFVIVARFDVADLESALSGTYLDFRFVRGPQRDCVRVRFAYPRVAGPSWESGRP